MRADGDKASAKQRNSETLGWTLLALPLVVMLLAEPIYEIATGQFSWVDGISLMIVVSGPMGGIGSIGGLAAGYKVDTLW